MRISSASLEPQLQAIDATPTLGPEHRQLDVFVGRWTAEGRTAAGPSGTSENMTHQHTYEWLPGGFHLLHRWDGRIGPRESKGIEIIGYDAGANVYEAHFFDSDGWARIYQARARDRVWTFSGPRERCSILFADDGTTMTIHWDHSPDGQTWQPLCDVKATRT
jgi:Protein of unknown function (DUF1579)